MLDGGYCRVIPCKIYQISTSALHDPFRFILYFIQLNITKSGYKEVGFYIVLLLKFKFKNITMKKSVLILIVLVLFIPKYSKAQNNNTGAIAGVAGGFLGIACMATCRGGFFGASFGAFSAVLGVARAAARSVDRIKSLESSIGTFGTDLTGLDMRFRALHEESSDTAARVGWVSEDARVASKAALGIEVGLLELERQGQARENYFASQVARVDRLIIAMRAVLLDVGITFSHSHGSFLALGEMVGRFESRL